MTEYRALGTVERFTAASTIDLTVTLTGGGGATLNASDHAYPTVAAASVYRFPDLCQYVTKSTQTWIYDALNGDAAVTTKPSSAAAIDVTLTFTPSLTPGGALCSLVIGPTLGGAKIAGVTATISALSLTNADGLWARLGLAYAFTARSASVAAGVATLTGLFQPRSIFTFLRSEVDDGDGIESALAKVLHLQSGQVVTFDAGRTLTSASLRLVDLDENVAGRSIPIGRASSLNADGVTVILPNPSTALLSGISSLYYQSDLITVGAFAEVGGRWAGRIKTSSTSSIVLCDKVPSSVSLPAACIVSQISEVQALWYEARRTGYLVKYGMVESAGVSFGAIRWSSEEYALVADSTYRPERLDVGNPLYSYTFTLTRRDASGLTLVS